MDAARAMQDMLQRRPELSGVWGLRGYVIGLFLTIILISEPMTSWIRQRSRGGEGADVSIFEIMFFASWIITGCCIESMLDDGRVLIIALVALIVAVVSGLRLIRERLVKE